MGHVYHVAGLMLKVGRLPTCAVYRSGFRFRRKIRLLHDVQGREFSPINALLNLAKNAAEALCVTNHADFSRALFRFDDAVTRLS